jgi:hypothetical protein
VIISRERYIDDTVKYAVSLALVTRTHEMHSVLSDAPDEVRDRLGNILVQALDQIQTVLTPMLDRPPTRTGMTGVGCGT